MSETLSPLAPPKNHPSVSLTGSQPAARLTHIDALRGLLLVLMAVNHIPSPLHPFTEHPLGFMSAAEGFVFMAGLMAGYVYTRTWLRRDFTALRQACTRRAIGIYRQHIAIFVLVLAGLAIAGFCAGTLPANTPESFLHHPARLLLSGLVLIQQPSLFDILPMYFALIFATPWLLKACDRRREIHLLAGSFFLWAAANIFSPQTPVDNGWVNTGAFNLAAWQLLYVVGVTLGHRWARRTSIPPAETSRPCAHILGSPPRWALASAALVATYLFSVRHGFLPAPVSAESLAAITNKNNLAPVRLLDTAVILFFVYLAASRFPRAFSWRPLAWIGRASLTVFSIHVLVAYAIQSSPEIFADTAAGPWIGTGLMLAALALAATAQNLSNRKPTATATVRPLQTRQRSTQPTIVGHEPRTPVPANSFHRGSR